MKPAVALTNCSILDINTVHVLAGRTIFIDRDEKKPEGVIAGIRLPGEGVPDCYQEIDIARKIVMPGLINAHVHLFYSGRPVRKAPSVWQQRLIQAAAGGAAGRLLLGEAMRRNAQTLLESGVTSARCVGDPYFLDVQVAREIKEGKIPGPTLLAAGYMISPFGGHGAPFLARTGSTPQILRNLVRANKESGVDLIKMCATGGVVEAGRGKSAGMTEDMALAVCEEAHSLGMMVAAHAESTEGIRTALKCGADTIEHGALLDAEIIRLFRNNPRSLRGYSALVPTVSAFMPGQLDQAVTKFGEEDIERSRSACRNILEGLGQALQAGVRIGVGTDASMPYATHYNTWRELKYLVDFAGVDTAHALYYATGANADILGLNTGSIAVGKSADMVVLEENPLDNIRTLAHPLLVIARGRMLMNPITKKIKKVDELLETL